MIKNVVSNEAAQCISKDKERLDGDAFDGAFVRSTSDAKVTLFAPLLSPAVLYRPELSSGCLLNPIADEKNSMVG